MKRLNQVMYTDSKVDQIMHSVFNSLRQILWWIVCNIKSKGMVDNHFSNVCAHVMKCIVYKCNGVISSLNQLSKPVKYIHTNVENMNFDSVQT